MRYYFQKSTDNLKTMNQSIKFSKSRFFKLQGAFFTIKFTKCKSIIVKRLINHSKAIVKQAKH